MSKIGIVGAGAWGTALAAAIGVALDASIHATTKLAAAIDAEMVLLVAPAQYMRAVGEAAAPDWRPGVPAVICAKGIERDSCALMSEVIAEAIPGVAAAVLSGPTFAAEVAIDLPTAVTLACNDELIGKVLMETLSSRNFRIYRSRDVIGAQIGGAVKNVLAIACGIVQGRGLGDNTRAALVTRGLAEMIRLGTAKGARPETLAGLSGLGDLALTCNAMQSRNFSLGVALGEGASLDEVLAGRNSVAEGVFTAASVTELARRLGVEAPICAAVDGVLNHFADIDAAIAGLLSRPLKEETA